MEIDTYMILLLFLLHLLVVPRFEKKNRAREKEIQDNAKQAWSSEKTWQCLSMKGILCKLIGTSITIDTITMTIFWGWIS